MLDMTLYNLPADSHVLRAAKRLVRLIHEEGLGPGSEFPKQEELRARLSFSNDTLNAALKVLSHAGMLKRLRRSGTVVENPDAKVSGLWSVLIAYSQDTLDECPFFYQTFIYSQNCLNARGCRIFLTARAKRNHPEPDSLDCFPDLAGTLESGIVDGLLYFTTFDTPSVAWLEKRGIPAAHLGSWEAAGSGAVMDSGLVGEDGLKYLHAQGCRRFCVICNYPPREGYDRWWEAAKRTRSSLKGCGRELMLLHKGDGFSAGLECGRTLLEMPAGLRPDGLLVMDDRIACGLTSLLAKSTYHPRLAVRASLQAPLPMQLPAAVFETDLAILSEAAVGNLMAMVSNPSIGNRFSWIPHNPPRAVEPPFLEAGRCGGAT